MLQSSNITKEEMASNPQAVIEVLEFYAGNLAASAGNLVASGEGDAEEMPKLDDLKKSLPLLPNDTAAPPVPSSPSPAKKAVHVPPPPPPQKASVGSSKVLPSAHSESNLNTAGQEQEPSKREKRRLSTLSDAQLMETLRVIVSKQDPTQIYTKIKNIGQG